MREEEATRAPGRTGGTRCGSGICLTLLKPRVNLGPAERELEVNSRFKQNKPAAQPRPGVPVMIDEVRTLYSWGVRLEEEIVLDRRVSTPLLQGLIKHELRSCKENQRLSWD